MLKSSIVVNSYRRNCWVKRTLRLRHDDKARMSLAEAAALVTAFCVSRQKQFVGFLLRFAGGNEYDIPLERRAT
jgi:hypothetical protein